MPYHWLVFFENGTFIAYGDVFGEWRVGDDRKTLIFDTSNNREVLKFGISDSDLALLIYHEGNPFTVMYRKVE